MNAKRNKRDARRNSAKTPTARRRSAGLAKAKREPGPPLTVRKKLLFSAIMVAVFFCLLELLLLAAGVRPVLTEKDPYVGFSTQVPLLEEKQVGGRAVLEIAPNKLRWFNAQSFPKQKSADTYRVFSVGGSTTYGRPYNDQVSFSGWLRELLYEADSTRSWEVVNVGGISYASYRVVRVMEELSAHEPDLFIVYTGHNEFLEERTYRDLKRLPLILRNVGALLGHTRLYALLHRSWHGESAETASEIGETSTKDLEQEVHTRLDGGVGPDAYERDEELSTRILEHFRFNLQRMIRIARQADAEIILVAPASNLSDCSPFKSEHDQAFSEEGAWQASYDAAQQAFDERRFEAARVEIENALKLSRRHAHTHYLHGRILGKIGLHEPARQAFERARDNDVCPLRALSRTVDIVREVAAEQQVPLIDFEHLVDQQSAHGIPGESLFLDHVHPTIEGNRLLALALFDELVNRQVLARPDDWDAAVDRVVHRVDSQVNQSAHGQALRNLSKVLAWAGKKEESNALALKASRLIGGDAETAYLAGNALLSEGNTDAAIAKFIEALEMNPKHAQAHNSLGTAYLQRRDFDRALNSFQSVVEIDPDFAPVYNNLGALYQRRNETELAIKSYQQAIRLNPRYSKAYNNIGVLLRKQGKDGEAVEYFRNALKINADFPEAHFNLGTIFDRQGDRQAAQASYRRAVKLNPRYGPAYYRIGVQLDEQRQWRAALQAYRNALRQPRPPVEAARRVAWILATCPDGSLRSGNMAVQMAQQCATATNHTDPETLSTLAASHAEANDFDKAVRWQTRALELATPEDRAKHQARLDTLQSRQPIRQ